MLSRLRSMLPTGNRKYPLKYRRMLSIIADRLHFAKSRYVFGKIQKTPGTEMLRYFLQGLSMVELDSYSSDLERYTEVIKFYKNNKLNVFDPVFGASLRGGKFVQRMGGLPPLEIFLNVDPVDPMNSLPLEKRWEEGWQELRGVKMLFSDTFEMISDFQTSTLEYKFDPPTFVVFSLDVSILVFKYYKYWKKCQEIGTECDVNEFLKRYELAGIFEDQYDVWLFNLISTVFINQAATADDILKLLHVPNRIVMENMLRQGIEGLIEFVGLARGGNMKLADFLATWWFPDHSIIDRLDNTTKWCDLPQRHHYLWMKILLYYPYLNIIMAVARLFPEGAVTKLLLERAYETYVKYFKYVKIPSLNGSAELRAFCEKLSDLVTNVLRGTPTELVLVSGKKANETPSGVSGESEEALNPTIIGIDGIVK